MSYLIRFWPAVHVVLTTLGAVFVALVILASSNRRQGLWTAADSATSAAQSSKSPYWYRCIRTLDVSANVFLRGLENVTLSSRIAVMIALHLSDSEPAGWFVNRWYRFLTWLQRRHGDQAMSGDIARSKAAIAYLTPVLAMQTSGALVPAPDETEAALRALKAAHIILTTYSAGKTQTK